GCGSGSGNCWCMSLPPIMSPPQNPGIFLDFANNQSVSFHEIDPHADIEIPNLKKFDGLWVMAQSRMNSANF
ncbi:MAG: hypothetical protein ABF331_09765, partial [Hellea sp.]